MAFKTFYCVLLLFCMLFTVAKGSCLEYGHSCWGAHGKRSGNSQIYHVDMKPATEVDFADVNAIKESPYDSSEDHFSSTHNKIPLNPNLPKDDDETNDQNVDKVLKLKNILYKHLNKTGMHRVHEPSADNDAARRTSSFVDPFVNDRWRRLPIWNMRRYQVNNDNWQNNMAGEQQQPRLIPDTEDYI